jgi:ABC-type transport system involved in cytochrome bd biosynthesis fused ATPase/permease subunit
MEDLGELGFWLAVGIVLAAWILSSGQKEREKERQKQETLRALLTTEGKSTTEIVAYMRESDAAEQKREADLQVAMNKAGRKLLAIFAAVMAGIVSFLVSVRALNGAGDQTQSWPVAVVLIGPFAVGALIAFLVYVLIRGKKNVPPPGA